jgi:hypothetical protein
MESGAQGLVAGLTAWFCFYALHDLIDWFDPHMFGREPVGMGGTYVACAMAATYAAWWVRSDQAKNVRGPARPDLGPLAPLCTGNAIRERHVLNALGQRNLPPLEAQWPCVCGSHRLGREGILPVAVDLRACACVCR